MDAVRRLRSAVPDSLRGGHQARVLPAAVTVQGGVHAVDIGDHALRLLLHGVRGRILGTFSEQGIGGGIHLGRELAHADVLVAAVPVEDALEPVGIGDDAFSALHQARILRGAIEPIGCLLCALTELGGAVGDALGGGDQAGVFRGAVAGDDVTGLGDTAGIVLGPGGELIGARDQARILLGAVALDAGCQLVHAVEQSGLAVRAAHARPELAGSVGQTLGAGGELIEPVRELAGAVGRLPGAVGEAPHAPAELPRALGGLLRAVGELAAPVREARGAVGEVRGAVVELLRAVGGTGEPVVEVVEPEVETVEVLLGHLPAHRGGRGIGDRGAHQGVDLPAGVVRGDLEDRLRGLGGADRRELLREVLRDHDHGGVGAVGQALLGVVLRGELPVEAGGLRGIGFVDGSRLGEGPGEQTPEGHLLGLAVGIGDLGALVEVDDGGRHRVEPVHAAAERPQSDACHQQGEQEHHDQGAGMLEAGHARAPSETEAVER